MSVKSAYFLPVGTVTTAPSPATSGTSLFVSTTDAARLSTGFAIAVPSGELPTLGNAEGITIDNANTGTGELTITRAVKGTAQSIDVGWIIYNSTFNANGELEIVSDAANAFQVVKATGSTQVLWADPLNDEAGIGANTLFYINDVYFNEKAAPAVSDAGSGRIYFDATENKFKASENGGAYKALLSPRSAVYTVTRNSAFSADYTCDGTADDVQIQAAIDAANTAGGGTVVLRAGTNPYRIAATIVVPENVTLLGERMARQSAGGVTLKTAASVNLTNMFEMTGSSSPANNAALKHDFHFENITFDGNNTTTNAVMLTNQDTVKFINCRFISSTNSVNTTWDHTNAPGAGNIPGGIYLHRCNISSTGTGIGVILNYQTQCWISDCWFTATSGTPTAWIKFNCCNKIKVTNCEFNTATNALWFTDVNTSSTLDFPCHNLNISGCAFANGSGVINDDRTHASSGYVQINGSMASGTTAGDTLVGSGNSAILGGTNYVSGDLTVPDEAYGVGWNASLEVPTKNAVYDKVETLMANPMTTAGDIIYGGASGVSTRLAAGTAGQVLTMNAGATAPEWAAASGGGGTTASTIAFSSLFENMTRYSISTSGGDASGGTVTATGAVITSGTASSGYAKTLLRNLTIAAWDGNSEFASFISNYTATAGASLQAYWGVGDLTTNGTAITFTGKHYGFKIVRSSSTSTYSYTNADGTTETAGSFAYSETSTLWFAKKTGTTNIKYYKDGTLLGTVTTNLPSGSTQYPVGFAISNTGSNTTNTSLQVLGFNYRKDAE